MYKLVNSKIPRTVKSKVTLKNDNNDVISTDSFKPLEITYSYLNYTGDDICILNRDGLRTIIKPTMNPNSHQVVGLVVLKKYRFHDTVIFDTTSLLNEISDEDENVLRKAFENKRKSDYQFSETELVYTVTNEMMHECDDYIFIRELDIVITKVSNKEAIHPYSKAGLLLEGMEENDRMIGMNLKWITHDLTYKCLYTKLYDEVLAIDTTYDTNLEEGFYIYLKRNSRDKFTTVVRLTLEEAISKFNLTSDYQSASKQLSLEEMLLNDVEVKKLELKNKILELEHSSKLEQLELTKDQTLAKVYELERKNELEAEKHKRELEQIKINHEENLRKIEAEREKAKREIETLMRKLELEETANRRKDYYDERSHYRKDSSEYIKWFPTALIGMSLLFKFLI